MEHILKVHAENEVANKLGGLFPAAVQVFLISDFAHRLKKKDVCISCRLPNNTYCLIDTFENYLR